MQTTKIILSTTALLFPLLLLAQTRHTVSGTVRDSTSGETLIGASILLLERPHSAVLSNSYGFYSLNAPSGHYHLIVSFTGFQQDTIPVSLDHDLTLAIQLTPGAPQLQEVVVSGSRNTSNVTK